MRLGLRVRGAVLPSGRARGPRRAKAIGSRPYTLHLQAYLLFAVATAPTHTHYTLTQSSVNSQLSQGSQATGPSGSQRSALSTGRTRQDQSARNKRLTQLTKPSKKREDET